MNRTIAALFIALFLHGSSYASDCPTLRKEAWPGYASQRLNSGSSFVLGEVQGLLAIESAWNDRDFQVYLVKLKPYKIWSRDSLENLIDKDGFLYIKIAAWMQPEPRNRFLTARVLKMWERTKFWHISGTGKPKTVFGETFRTVWSNSCLMMGTPGYEAFEPVLTKLIKAQESRISETQTNE